MVVDWLFGCIVVSKMVGINIGIVESFTQLFACFRGMMTTKILSTADSSNDLWLPIVKWIRRVLELARTAWIQPMVCIFTVPMLYLQGQLQLTICELVVFWWFTSCWMERVGYVVSRSSINPSGSSKAESSQELAGTIRRPSQEWLSGGTA